MLLPKRKERSGAGGFSHGKTRTAYLSLSRKSSEMHHSPAVPTRV